MTSASNQAAARLDAALARAEGRRDALAQRAERLSREVELAKGRLAIRSDVEAFIEAVHGSASRRNLAAFETLLTTLVQEVLPGEKPVALDLSTERGLAALDICVRRPDGTLEDVLEDNGGALTNVISMALRLIAVVKADVARFLALDEADCWIAPDRVPAFYKVLEDCAARLNVQCLAVSHHDLSAFKGHFHLARITGEPQQGVTIVSDGNGFAWSDERSGLRFIRLVNVQAYRDATLHLSPGVNALIGPNNRGKSTFIRALRAVFYGEARDSLVRAGTKSATVEIGVAGGRILRFTRQPRRSPVNIWSLHEADGSIVEDRGTRFETGGRTVPDWVAALFAITKVEDLDLHIAHQKFPVFLLGETPSRRSAVLSIGQEASYIRDMLTIHRERCTRDNTFVKTSERELIGIGEALERMKELEPLEGKVREAHLQAEQIEALAARLVALERHRDGLSELERKLERARTRARATGALPKPEHLTELLRTAARAEEQKRVGHQVLDRLERLERARRKRDALQALPDALPALESAATAQDMVTTLVALRDARSLAQGRLSQIATESRSVEASMDALVAEMGGLCPTCGSTIDASNVLHHSHTLVGQATA